MPEEDIIIETTTPSSSGVRGDLNFRLIVMRQIDRCGIILSKQPHEFQAQGVSNLSGCTYEDICLSFHDSVRLLESLISAYRDDQYTQDIANLLKDYNAKKNVDPDDRLADYNNNKNANAHNFYFQKYAYIISLCARLGLMLEPVGEDVV